MTLSPPLFLTNAEPPASLTGNIQVTSSETRHQRWSIVVTFSLHSILENHICLMLKKFIIEDTYRHYCYKIKLAAGVVLICPPISTNLLPSNPQGKFLNVVFVKEYLTKTGIVVNVSDTEQLLLCVVLHLCAPMLLQVWLRPLRVRERSRAQWCLRY